MVLESMFEEKSIKKHPLFVLFMAIAVSSVGIWISYISFPNYASVLSIAFVAIGFMPLLHNLLTDEEAIEAAQPGIAIGFIARHFTIIRIFAWFFIGLIVSYSFWYVFLPTEIHEKVFMEQKNTTGQISELRAQVTGKAIQQPSPVCGKNFECWFQLILENNAKVLALEVIFSFIYGVGALFFVAWNASVIATVIGKDILGMATNPTIASAGTMAMPLAYVTGLFNAVGFLPHGLPEILAYFVGGIAGAIISAAISRKSYKRENELWIIAKDAMALILIAFILLVIGAAIEAQLIIGTV